MTVWAVLSSDICQSIAAMAFSVILVTARIMRRGSGSWGICVTEVLQWGLEATPVGDMEILLSEDRFSIYRNSKSAQIMQTCDQFANNKHQLIPRQPVHTNSL